jgi:Carbohydrate binding module (family 6).
MRKLLSILLVLCLCFSMTIAFASCGEKADDATDDTADTAEGGEEVVDETPNPDPIVLTADQAALTGGGADASELQVEAGGNLGYWKAGNEASWTITVPKAGKYTVLLNYSKGTSQSAEVIAAAGDATASVTIEPTPSWTDWADIEIGTLDLAAGEVVLTIKPGEMPEADLMNLMTLTLTYQP